MADGYEIRLRDAYCDILDASFFCRKLCDKYDELDHLIKKALWISTIIAYGRVFKIANNDKLEGGEVTRLKDLYSALKSKIDLDLTAHQQDLNKELLKLRDCAFAHSDAVSRGHKSPPKNDIYIMNNSSRVWSLAETLDVLGLIEVVYQCIQHEIKEKYPETLGCNPLKGIFKDIEK